MPVFDVSPGKMYFSALSRLLRERAGPAHLTLVRKDYGSDWPGVIVKFHGEVEAAGNWVLAVEVIPNGTPVTPATVATRIQAFYESERRPRGTSAESGLEDLIAALHLALSSSCPPFELLKSPGRVEPGCEDYFAGVAMSLVRSFQSIG